MLNNLVGNATKFTKEGVVQLRVWRAGESVCFEISDTGIGMAEELVGQLFAPFHQGDDSITRQFGGTGLGLSISKELAELMGGTIKVSSELGVGSKFLLTLPLPVTHAPDPVRQTSGKNTSSSSPDDFPAEALEILLAEDNAINQIVGKKIMEKFGHRVTLANDGREAIDKVREGGFDVVVMDLEMPDIDGMQAAKVIRSLPGEERNVRIIAMSGHVLQECEDACHEAGMDGFISKPFDPAALKQLLKEQGSAGRELNRATSDREDFSDMLPS